LGLKHGQRLAWYAARNAAISTELPTTRRPAAAAPPGAMASELAAQLSEGARCQTPAEFLATQDPRMRLPGLYSCLSVAMPVAAPPEGFAAQFRPGTEAPLARRP